MRAKIIDLKKYKAKKNKVEEMAIEEEIEPVTVRVSKQGDKAIINLSTNTNWFRINQDNFELFVNQVKKTMNWKKL
jgi:histidinol dehydrogenase